MWEDDCSLCVTFQNCHWGSISVRMLSKQLSRQLPSVRMLSKQLSRQLPTRQHTRAEFNSTLRHNIHFPMHLLLGESPPPVWNVLNFVKWTREVYLDRPSTPQFEWTEQVYSTCTLQADPQTTMLVTSQQIALNLPPHNLVYDIDVW